MTVTPVNSTAVTLSWSEVQCFNGSGTVTHYLVQYQSMCGGPVENVTTSGTVQTVSGLTLSTEYTFQVAAVDVNGTGPFSQAVTQGGNYSITTICSIFLNCMLIKKVHIHDTAFYVLHC